MKRHPTKRRVGEQQACSTCGQDIEYGGRGVWTDRGGNVGCAPYQPHPGGEFVYPVGNHSPDAPSFRVGQRIGFHGSSHTATVVSTGPDLITVRDDSSGLEEVVKRSSSYIKKLRRRSAGGR